jgi:hypothetical protein
MRVSQLAVLAAASAVSVSAIPTDYGKYPSKSSCLQARNISKRSIGYGTYGTYTDYPPPPPPPTSYSPYASYGTYKRDAIPDVKSERDAAPTDYGTYPSKYSRL